MSIRLYFFSHFPKSTVHNLQYYIPVPLRYTVSVTKINVGLVLQVLTLNLTRYLDQEIVKGPF